jgi:hypothetical protein
MNESNSTYIDIFRLDINLNIRLNNQFKQKSSRFNLIMLERKLKVPLTRQLISQINNQIINKILNEII